MTVVCAALGSARMLPLGVRCHGAPDRTPLCTAAVADVIGAVSVTQQG